MKRGPKPKPTIVRRLTGNPGGHPFNEHEPILPPLDDDTPEPPELADNAVALAEWRRLLPILTRASVLTDGDRAVLVATCQQWARYLLASTKADAELVVKSQSGYLMPSPWLGIANKALGNCLRCWVELGLTPSARTRVATAPGGTAAGYDDAFAEFDDPPSTAAH